ncbi:MAG: phage minor head protein [Pseudomonadota bacterium]
MTQREAGILSYTWITMGDELVRDDHSVNDGRIFFWSDPPPTGHPGEDYNCRCHAGPPELSAIYKSLLRALLLSILAKYAKRIKDTVFRIKKKKKPEEENPTPKKPEGEDADGRKPGQQAPEGGRKDTEWEFGKHKSKTKWDNRKNNRGWTDEQITDTIKNGDAFPAPNNVRRNDPKATATRYEYQGKFVVRDDQTKEILQISGDDFIPKDL